MGIKFTGQWKQATAAMSNLSLRAKAAEHVATLQEAHFYRVKVLDAFKTSGASNGRPWEPNAPSVVAEKGSSKPLIDTGDLRQSVTVIDTGALVFVGVPSKKRARDADAPLVSIAEVHEFGKIILIPVTDKMRKFLMAKLAELGFPESTGRGEFLGNILILEIPERSFLRSTADKYYSNRTIIRDRYLRRLAKALGPGWDVLARAS